MSVPDDRDWSRPKHPTPLAGVRAIRDDETPVDATPDMHRATVGDLAQVELRVIAKVEEWVKKDEKQHDEIKDEVREMRSDYKSMRGDYQTLNGIVTETRTETKIQSLSLDALVQESTISRQRKAALDLKKAEIELNEGSGKKMKQTEFKWDVGKKVVVGLIGLALVIGTHYVGQCRAPSASTQAHPLDAGVHR